MLERKLSLAVLASSRQSQLCGRHIDAQLDGTPTLSQLPHNICDMQIVSEQNERWPVKGCRCEYLHFSLSTLELNYEALSDVWPQWLRRCRESRWFIRRWCVHFVHPFIQVTGASKAHHTGLYNCHEKCSRPTTAHDISTHCCREIWGDSAHFPQMMSDSAPGFITQLMYF